MNAIFELWSKLMPERAIACSFNLEYLLVGGRDARHARPAVLHVVRLDGRRLGRPQRQGRLEPRRRRIFGVGLAVQPLEGQERLCPGAHDAATRSSPTPAGPGKLPRRLRRREGRHADAGRAHGHVLLLRPRALDHLGHRGRSAVDPARRLAEPGHGRASASSAPIFSNVPVRQGDSFTRPSAGGGGFGDPLERDPARCCEDVADGYVSIERARKDYGVVVERGRRRARRVRGRRGGDRARARAASAPSARGWLEEDPEDVAAPLPRRASSTCSTSIRRYGVILDWGTGELLPKTTGQFREMLQRRTAAHWAPAPAAV